MSCHLVVIIHRLQLAALHYNENSGRQQAKTKAGDNRYAIQYPKYKKGGYIVRNLLVESTYSKLHTVKQTWLNKSIQCFPDYVAELFRELLRIVEGQRALVEHPPIAPPSPLCGSFVHPVKDEAVTKFQSRFSL